MRRFSTDRSGGRLGALHRVSIVPKLVMEIERARQEAGLSVEDLLESVDEEHRRYYEEHYSDDSLD